MIYGALELADKPIWASRTEQLMRVQGLTREDLTDAFEVKTVGAVGHYLTGRRQPSPQQLINLKNKLNTSLGYLFQEVDSPNSDNFSLKLQGAKYLNEALQYLVTAKGISDKEHKALIAIVEKIGAENIVQVQNLIANAEESGEFGPAILSLESFRKSL